MFSADYTENSKDQSYLTDQAVLGHFAEMGYFKVQWYLQDFTKNLDCHKLSY